MQRLVRQTLSDPFGINPNEARAFYAKGEDYISFPATIRAFDSLITAPRWGYKDVDTYYSEASPIHSLDSNHNFLQQTLLLQAMDDPWVPVKSVKGLLNKKHAGYIDNVEIILTPHGGHNGFHGYGGCWGDQLVVKWLLGLCAKSG